MNPSKESWKLSTEEREQAVADYLAGTSATAIAARHGISIAAVCQMLCRRGIDRRQGCEYNRLPVNESAFENAEANEEAAYWIGFLMADGCVAYNRRGGAASISLTIHAGDAEHVRSFRTFLRSDHEISFGRNKRGTPTAGITIGCQKLADDLSRYGVVPRKSFIAKVAHLENSPHFWRGAIDGDGCIQMQKQKRELRLPVLELVGSKSLVNQFHDFCKSISPKCQAVARPRVNIWKFAISGRFAMPVIRALYGSCTIALPRKLVQAQEALQWVYAGGRDHSSITLDDLNSLVAIHGTWGKVAAHLDICQSQLSVMRKRRIKAAF